MDGQIDKVTRKSDHIETSQNLDDFKNWPAELIEEMKQSHNNGCVGSILVSETPQLRVCLLYTSPSPRDATLSRMPSSA